MIRELKGFIIGVVLTMAFSVSANVWQTISVQPNSVNIVINGKKIAVDNFLYNDTTYIPIRAVSTALSQDVSYDDKTNTAYIGKKGIDKVSTEEFGGRKWNVGYDENNDKYYEWDTYNHKELLKNSYIMLVYSKQGTNESWEIRLYKGNEVPDIENGTKLKENISYKIINDRIMISEKYFTEEILPLDK